MSAENNSSEESTSKPKKIKVIPVYTGPGNPEVAKFKKHDLDGGSSEVQIAILTQKLQYLGEHFKKHPQDVHSQRGMQRMINQRKKLLAYLRGSNLASYKSVISELGIRK